MYYILYVLYVINSLLYIERESVYIMYVLYIVLIVPGKSWKTARDNFHTEFGNDNFKKRYFFDLQLIASKSGASQLCLGFLDKLNVKIDFLVIRPTSPDPAREAV